MTDPTGGRTGWKPGVPNTVLILLAGTVWLVVGFILNRIAFFWLQAVPGTHAVTAAVIGLIGALLIHHFGFLRLVDRNLERIRPMSGPRCLFSFMPWKSYLLVAVMIALGYALRHSALPRWALAVVYSAIGTALMLSSVRYLRITFVSLRAEKNEQPIGPDRKA